MECPCFNEIRSELTLTRNATMEDWNINTIIQFAKHKAIKQALAFENVTNPPSLSPAPRSES